MSDPPLRILQLYPKEDYFTGAAIQVRELALGLHARGHDVIIGTRPSDIWSAKTREAGVPHHALPMASEVEIGKHTSELQSHSDLVCRLLLEKKKKNNTR